jgi:hypothetical protein
VQHPRQLAHQPHPIAELSPEYRRVRAIHNNGSATIRGHTDIATNPVHAFAEQALGIVNGGFLSLMLSIGHRTGLFDLLARLPPSSSGRIASEARLSERYVRE